MGAPITDYVNLSISVATRGVSQASLETPLLMGYHTEWTDRRVREYTSLAGLEAAGFTSADPIHKMATALLGQDKRVERFKVGRRANAPVQAIDVTMLSDSVSNTVSITLRYGGQEETYSQVGLGTGLPAMATALAAKIVAGVFGVATYITAAGVGDDVQIRQGAGPVAGQIFYFDDLAFCSLEDVTADPGIAADLTAIRAEDDDWYFLLLDSNSEAEIEALDSVIEAISPDFKMMVVQTQDYSVPQDTAGHIGETLHDASLQRTALYYTPFSLDEYPACAAVGERAPYKPGQNTWMFKLLRGVTAIQGQLDSTQLAALKANDVNHFIYSAGRGDTRFGTMADGSFIDDRHLLDYLSFRIPEEIMSAFRNPLKKIPYTDKAPKIIRRLILKVLKTAETWGALQLVDPDTGASTFSFSSTIAAGDQASADILDRIFRGIEWSVLRTGSVHKFYITGTLTDASGN